MDLNRLWHSDSEESWLQAINYYDRYILTENVRRVDDEIDPLDSRWLAHMDENEWYEFLKEKYFPWKFTSPNRLATTTLSLDKYVRENGVAKLLSIRDQLLQLNPDDTKQGLVIATQIGGLGPAGASGLLSLLYPNHFGTVDVFLVAAISRVQGLEEAERISRLEERRRRAGTKNTSFALSIPDAEMLIRIMRRKAEELNRTFSTTAWTPRAIDKVLWACGHT